jgi:molecular chaperone DnaK
LTGKDPNKSVNPDEVVAVGAAIQAGVLSGQVRDVVLLDVTPLTLGVETLGGIMTKLIERNTTIPTRKSDVFSTAADGQTDVEIHVLQGEREMARDNRTLGRFHLTGVPPAPRGVPRIEVTFDIDANGILNVAAKDLGTGRQQAITITGSGQLSKDDIGAKVKDAQAHEAEDKSRRELAEARNQADSLMYSTEKTLKDMGDKVPADVRSSVESAMNDLREAAKGEDAARIRSAIEVLQQASYKLSEILYQQAAAGAAAGAQEQAEAPAGEPSEEQKPPDEGVIDAEFKKEE